MKEMREYDREAPELPRETCPTIDGIRDMLEDMLRTAKGELEELREANATLREAAEFWRETTIEVLRDATELEVEKDAEIAEQAERIKELERDLLDERVGI